MSNNKKNDAVEHPQMTRYYRRKMVAILKQLRHVINKDIDNYIEYILSEDTNTIDNKSGVTLLDDLAFMRDFIKYINRQMLSKRNTNNYTDKDC